MTTTTIVNKRVTTWALTATPATSACAANMVANGWEPTNYYGESQPQGRQVKRHALFVRSQKTGKFTMLHMIS